MKFKDGRISNIRVSIPVVMLLFGFSLAATISKVLKPQCDKKEFQILYEFFVL